MDPSLSAPAIHGLSGVWPLVLRVGAGLALVLGGIVLLALLLRRFTARRRVSRDRFGPEVISSIHLAPRQALYLVRVCDRAVLVGAGRDGLTSLGTFTLPGREPTVTPETEPAAAPEGPSFLDYVEARLRGAARPRSHLPGDAAAPSSRLTANKLAP